MKRILATAALALALSGCCHNLQGSFVQAMDDTMVAIEADVEAGLYKPDAASAETLLKAKTAIKDAKDVLAKEEAK